MLNRKEVLKAFRPASPCYNGLMPLNAPSLQKTGSTSRLSKLCLAFFLTYVVMGILVKYFLGSPANHFPGMSEMEYVVYFTIGSTVPSLIVVLLLGWHRVKCSELPTSKIKMPWGSALPRELLYLVPSGICASIIIVTTTLLYTLPTSVMVAMILLRGGVIVASRVVDEIQIRQGLFQKKITTQENIAVFFALLAVCSSAFAVRGPEQFGIFKHPLALAVLLGNVAAYGLRIYIMNYYKNSITAGSPIKKRGYFAIEQITATTALGIFGAAVFWAGPLFWQHPPIQVEGFRQCLTKPHPQWLVAVFSGPTAAIAAFLSFMILMQEGRSATFLGILNRMITVIAGTIATLVFYLFFKGQAPSTIDWVSFVFILFALYFLGNSETKKQLSQ